MLLGHDWFAQSWKCCPEVRWGEQPEVIVLRQANGACAALLALRHNRKTRRICFLEERRSQRLDAIAAPGFDPWPALARHFRARRDWDRLDLLFLRPASAARIVQSFPVAGLAVRERGTVVQRLIGLDRPWAATEATFGPYLQANFKRRLRRLEARGRVQLQCFERPGELAGPLAECFALERAGWKGQQHTAILNDGTLHRFYHQLAFRLSARHQFRLYCLRVGEQLAAFEYCAAGGARLYPLKIAYDEALRNASPGLVLRWLLLQAEQGRIAAYEFLGHDVAWKADWTPDTVTLHHLRIYNRTLGGQYWLARTRLNRLWQRWRPAASRA